MSRLTRFANLFRRGGLEQDLEDEVAFHIDMRTGHNLRRGLSYEDAAIDAHLRFGDVARVKDEMRRVRVPSLSRAQAAGMVVAGGLVAAIGAAAIVNSQRTVYQADARGLTMPTLLKHENPRYTEEALRKRIRGAVLLHCVVETTGVCSNLKVTKALDPEGLDQQALHAARNWRFRPGMRFGQPVPVAVTVEMRFTWR